MTNSIKNNSSTNGNLYNSSITDCKEIFEEFEKKICEKIEDNKK